MGRRGHHPPRFPETRESFGEPWRAERVGSMITGTRWRPSRGQTVRSRARSRPADVRIEDRTTGPGHMRRVGRCWTEVRGGHHRGRTLKIRGEERNGSRSAGSTTVSATTEPKGGSVDAVRRGATRRAPDPPRDAGRRPPPLDARVALQRFFHSSSPRCACLPLTSGADLGEHDPAGVDAESDRKWSSW